MELQAALLASRLSKTIRKESRLEFEEIIYFTDSKIVLAWIQSTSRVYKQFVSSTVGEIQSNSDPKQWRHIPSEANVADDVSRGIAVHDLNKRRLQGPEFLRLPQNDWPVSKETRKLVCTLKTQESPIDPKKYSTWRKLIRFTAYVLKFVRKIRNKTRKIEATGEDSPDCLSPRELYEAEIHWIKDTQKDLHSRIKKGELTTLSPFTDSEGVIRVGIARNSRH